MSILSEISLVNGDVYDKPLEALYGERHGFKFVVKQYQNKNFILLLSVKKDDGPVAIEYNKVLKQSANTVQAVKFNQYLLTCNIKPGLTKNARKANILEAIEDVTAYLSDNGFEFCCERTGQTNDVSLYTIGQQFTFLNADVYSQMSQEVGQAQQEKLATNENMLLGSVGAFLGSLIGVAAIVIIGQMGYVSFISGVIMGVCVLKGYELLAKKISRKGAVISTIIILIMTYFANQLDWAFTAARAYEVSVFDTLPIINDLLAEGYIDATVYMTNLVMIYIFTVLSAGYMIFSELKTQANKFDIRKLF